MNVLENVDRVLGASQRGLQRFQTRAVYEDASAWLEILAERSDEATNTEFAQWLREAPVHVQAWLEVTAFHEELARMLGRAPFRTAATDTNAAGKSQWVARHRTTLASTPRQRRWGMACAAIVLTSLAALFAFDHLNSRATEYFTGTGENRLISLEDGSRVHLNTRSHIRVRYDHDQRWVELVAGEALFSVAHGRRPPFRVLTGHTVIEDVGTAFQIRRDQTGTSVLVTEGTVRIFGNRKYVDRNGRTPGLARVDLRAGDRIHIAENSRETRVAVKHLTAQEVDRQLGWLNGRLYFEGTTLAEAVAEFNRYNQSQISVADPTIEDLKIGGGFVATDTGAFLKALTRIHIATVSATENGKPVVRLRRSEPDAIK